MNVSLMMVMFLKLYIRLSNGIVPGGNDSLIVPAVHSSPAPLNDILVVGGAQRGENGISSS